MDNKKNACLLSAALFFTVFLILFISSMTETGYLSKGFVIASLIAAAATAFCAIYWAILDTCEKRPWAADKTNYKYRKLKRKTAKALKAVYFNGIEQAKHERFVYEMFLLNAEECGIERGQAARDFERLKK